ncbi:MAG: hypothetical protein JWP11_494 [Frankiales bacterium]|nr:hypothetical protein [Frankiales bacterium]
MTVNPWRVLRGAWPMTQGWADLPAGERGRLYPKLSVILLDRRLGQAALRSTLAHDLAHWILDHDTCYDRRSGHRLEREAEAFAARWLVDIEQYVRALRWSSNDHEVADELWIDLPLLAAWRECMDEEERAYVDQHRNSEHEWGVA